MLGRNWLSRAVLCLVLICSVGAPRALGAETDADDRVRGKRLWKISLGVLAGAFAADVATSYGRREMNPLVAGADGRFSGRGLAIKGALAGATIGTQLLLIKRGGAGAKPAAYTNLGMAGLLSGAAIYNQKVGATRRPAYLLK